MNPIERSAIRKAFLRIIPFTSLLYLVCYVDRINAGFAALTMNKELGFSPTLYGWGAGIFFWGYFLFEVPSNVILEKVGARRWICRIMLTWGLVSASMAFISGPTSFLIVRFLFGVAEAGFAPGMFLYFTYWFPARYRGRIVACYLITLPLSVAIGAPVSTALMELDGLFGIAGWRWLFLCEAAPALLLGLVVPFYLTDRPAQAHWLTSDEKTWLQRELDGERRAIEGTRTYSLWQALLSPRVMSLSILFLGIGIASVGMVAFLPQIIKALGVSNMMTGVFVSIPYIVGSIAMIAWGYVSDRMNERRWNLVISCGCAVIGMVAIGYTIGTWWALVAMCFAAVGFYGMKPVFWPLPSDFLSGTAAAGGIAIINSIGNLGGFFGPMLLGWTKEMTGGFSAGIYILAGCALVSTLLALGVPGRSSSSAVKFGAAPAPGD
jgi:ACS family tartrate transporter-like MFS transporter